MSSNKVIVQNLPFSCDNNALYEHFKDCGEITDAVVILNKETKRSRGFGFVTFSTEAARDKAIAMAGSELEGREIRVLKADEKPARDNKPRFQKREPQQHHSRGDGNENLKIFVSQLAWAVTDDDLREAFSKFGEIADCAVLRDRATGKSRGRGIVRFTTEESVAQAVSEMNGADLKGRAIAVRQFMPSTEGTAATPAPTNKKIVFDEEEKKEVEEKKEEEPVKAAVKEEDDEESSSEESDDEEKKEEEMKEESSDDDDSDDDSEEEEEGKKEESSDDSDDSEEEEEGKKEESSDDSDDSDDSSDSDSD